MTRCRNGHASMSPSGNCRVCNQEAVRRYRLRHPEAVSASRAKDRAKEQASGKRQVRHLLRKAMRQGIVPMQPCSECGAAKTEAHHHKGYDLAVALDVVWLCPQHHREVHRG